MAPPTAMATSMFMGHRAWCPVDGVSRPVGLRCAALTKPVPIRQTLRDLALEAAFDGAVEALPRELVGEIALTRESLLGAVIVGVPGPIAEVLHQACRCVEDVLGRHKRTRLPRCPHCRSKRRLGGDRKSQRRNFSTYCE